ncbi:hypothetical protein [Thermomonospora umbrina]|uniref:hypothetical protein n=1 Tax=Thermomonospora umbrina TaxID=111806 RepID=UPI0011C16F3A|nr:hypothetical protein [Thermomonospora umbrina]
MTAGEETLSEPFWNLGDAEEERVVQDILKRRFPVTYPLLGRSLEVADPMNVVYPGNSDEYSDVVRELVVLLAPVNGDISKLGAADLKGLIVEALARCFGGEAEESRVESAVRTLRRSFSEAALE